MSRAWAIPTRSRRIRARAIQAGLKLVDCPIRHMGTEKAQQIYYAIEQHLLNSGVEILFGCECRDLILENDVCKGVQVTIERRRSGNLCRSYRRGHRVAAARTGSKRICAEHNVAHQPGTVDIGVRVECRNEIMEQRQRGAV